MIVIQILCVSGVKAWSGKEDTTLLSMADCRVKQSTVSTATRYGIKPRIQGCPRGSVRIGGQSIRANKKKKKNIGIGLKPSMGIEPILDFHGCIGLLDLVWFPTGNFAGSSCKSRPKCLFQTPTGSRDGCSSNSKWRLMQFKP